MKILVTGAAGFIGFHLTNLLAMNHEVIGIDSLNEYYDVNLKYARLAEAGIGIEKIKYNNFLQSAKFKNYRFLQLNIEDKENLPKLFAAEKFEIIINLAAQAGVRYSLSNPFAYIESNISGFLNILECCRNNKPKHFIYASSSSVYGLNEAIPFQTSQPTEHPISLYAATKKSNEMMAHSYSHLFAIPSTGLRFFTVYGTWGRPDMALFIFTKAILEGTPIQVFNNGNMERDFTHVSDIVVGIELLLNQIPTSTPNWNAENPITNTSSATYKIFNIGRSQPVKLLDFVHAIEEATGKKAVKQYLPLQAGDVPQTFADVSDLASLVGYKPKVSVKDGVFEFVKWYRNFYKI